MHHGGRSALFILGEGVVRDPDFLTGGRAAGAPPPRVSGFKFGRMFPRPPKRATSKEWFELSEGLVKLGLLMNSEPPASTPPDSKIPAGYTYLGQFIAHEITFDDTQGLPNFEPVPENMRSPSLDLDSLYGGGPDDPKSRPFYEDGPKPARLKTGENDPDGISLKLDNDLPRDEQTGKASTGDPRNDENLAVAQATVALIKFHNKVVDTLRDAGYERDDLFECARKHVIRHFQWVVLYDYLPRIVDGDVLDCVRRHRRRWFKVGCRKDLFMPVEFSAAAFRIGHSMVRKEYQWNFYHSKDLNTKARLEELFEQTAMSGFIGAAAVKKLKSHWVIDWRRFFEFPQFPGPPQYAPASTGVNMAARIDTSFDMHLDGMPFDHGNLPPEKRSITVRNLLRGFALGLPTGEEVAEWIGETPMRPEVIAAGPHEAVLSTPAFKGKTPLWYYVLKEAELNEKGGWRLGPVGSRIVAETLVGIIENSRYSILDGREWYPKYTRRGTPGTESARFGMVDLLDFAGVVNPVGG